MLCPLCRSEVANDARFCSRCGADTIKAEAPTQLTQRTDRLQQPGSSQQTARSNIHLGRVIDDKFRIDGLLGQGDMGAVYCATRLLIGDQVAIKVLHPEQVSDPQAIERFRREAQAAARLKHPNAVTIYDFGVSSDKLVYLVMELVEGQSLRAILRQQGPMSASLAAEVISQICAALDEAHRHNIVHRDLKPDNVIVTQSQSGVRVKVLDFGIAKIHDLSTTASTLTQAGTVMGTPHYMSPEQCMGDTIDGRSDIYSLGVMLFEMLSGTVPFNSSTPTAIIVQHVNQVPPPLRQINASIPATVERVVMHALAKQRESRPQTARALAMELNNALSFGTGVNAAQPAGSNPTAYASYGGAAAGLAPTMQMQTPPSGSGMRVSGAAQQYISGSPATPWSGAEAAYTPKKKTAWPIAIFISLLLVAAGAVAIYLLTKSPVSPKENIVQEIRRGNLVKPEGTSAYDLYQKHAGTLTAQEKSEITNLAASQLEKRGTEIMSRRKLEEDLSGADWSEAARVYSWLNDLKPSPTNESRIYYSNGQLAFAKEDYNKALSDFQRSTQLEPKWAMPLNDLGRAYFRLKDNANANRYYGKATEVEPSWIVPYLNRSSILFEMYEKYRDEKYLYEAEKDIQRAIEIDYNRGSAHWRYGKFFDYQKLNCDALREYQLAIDNPPTDPNAEWMNYSRQRVIKIRSTTTCY